MHEAPLLKSAAVIALTYCSLVALFPTISAPVLTFITAGFVALWFSRLGMHLAAVAAFMGAALPFFMFIFLDRKIDGIYYELFLHTGIGSIWNVVLQSNVDFFTGGDSGRARGAFLLLTYPFIPASLTYEEQAFIPFNYLMVAGCAMTFCQFVRIYCINHEISGQWKPVAQISCALLFVSPTVIFFSNDLLKDQVSMLSVICAAILFLNKKYLPFAFIILISVSIRTYNPLIIACFILAAKKRGPWDYHCAVMMLALLIFIVDFSPTAIVNMVLAWPYVFINPLPIRAENWAFPTGLITFQGIILIIPFVISILQLSSIRLRKKGFDRIAISIALFACVVIAVGYNNITNFVGEEYTLGQGGENMTRKCFPILPLLFLQAALAYRYMMPKRTKQTGPSFAGKQSAGVPAAIGPKETDEAPGVTFTGDGHESARPS